jgi:hypothetical protein
MASSSRGPSPSLLGHHLGTAPGPGVRAAGLAFAWSCHLGVHLACQLVALRPGGRPSWQYVGAHAGLSTPAVAVPVLGALAMAVVPVHLLREEARAARGEGPLLDPVSSFLDPVGTPIMTVLNLVFWAGALAAIPVFVSVFKELDTLMLLAPVGAALLVPMALGYWMGSWVLRRGRGAPVRALAGRGSQDASRPLCESLAGTTSGRPSSPVSPPSALRPGS